MYDDRMTIVRPQPLTQLNMYCGRGSPADTVRNAGNVSMGHHFWEGPPRERGGGGGCTFHLRRNHSMVELRFIAQKQEI